MNSSVYFYKPLNHVIDPLYGYTRGYLQRSLFITIQYLYVDIFLTVIRCTTHAREIIRVFWIIKVYILVYCLTNCNNNGSVNYINIFYVDNNYDIIRVYLHRFIVNIFINYHSVDYYQVYNLL